MLAAEDATVRVDAGRVLGPISRHLAGACIEDVNHEIYGRVAEDGMPTRQNLAAGGARYTFPPMSFSVLRFE